MKSIMQDNKVCYVCGTPYNLHKHHIMKGIRNRHKAEKDGLWCYLCYEHHEGTNGVHGKNGKRLNTSLIMRAEKIWLDYYNKNYQDFIDRYGRNYL